MGVTLNSDQLKRVQVVTKNLHDIRSYELQADKQWNKKIIALLKQKNNPHFELQFTQLWNMQGSRLTGGAYPLEQQNRKLMAGLMKNLIMSFNSEQKKKLAKQLTSISRTFSEMANE